MKAESLIFDVDGTLWDVRGIVADVLNGILVRRGHADRQIEKDVFTSLFGKTAQEIADGCLAGLPDGLEMILQCMEEENVIIAQTEQRFEYPGTVETLEKLAQHHRLFVVTNGGVGYAEMTLKKLGVEHLFRGTLCHGQTGVSKGETIRLLMEQHGIESAVYIGDTLGDQEASDFAGLPFIWAAYGFGKPAHYAAKIDSINELPALMEDPA